MVQHEYVSIGVRPQFGGEQPARLPDRYKLPKELRYARNAHDAKRNFFQHVNDKYLTNSYVPPSPPGTTQQTDVSDPRLPVSEAMRRNVDAKEFFARCLEIEWAQELTNMHAFDLTGAAITAERRDRGTWLYRIDCEGLAEKRPSVLPGDTVAARRIETPQEGWHRGFVHFVNMDHVLVSFGDTFNSEGSFTVEFHASETAFYHQFNALRLTQTVLTEDEKLLVSDAKPNDDPELLRILDVTSRRLNDEQQECVSRVVCARRIPNSISLLLIHGPPGTGKSTTVVAALHGLLQIRSRRVRALVCTPTNESANLICEKLQALNVGDPKFGERVVRLCSASYTPPVDAAVALKLAITHEDVAHRLQRADIVVTTLIGAGRAWNFGANPGDFDHIFVDEAARAMETEVFVALMLASREQGTHITLAGDHLQLGPLIHSRVAVKYGFGISTLERLISSHPDFAVQLRDNYRSHPEVLRVYSELTYNGTLVPCADQKKTNVLQTSKIMPVRGKPIMFCHLNGREERQKDSPSWMNEQEAFHIVALIERLLTDHADHVKFEDIVVLSPYNKQCKEIRRLLVDKFTRREPRCFTFPRFDGRTLPIQVSNVELFQGREAKVIIMSCVRSRREEDVESDIQHGIGFLQQPKRLNVTISRAMAALIVVGHIGLLQRDPHWTALIDLFANDTAAKSCVVDVLNDNRQLTRAEILDLKDRYQRRRKAAAVAAPPPAAAADGGDDDDVVVIDRALGRSE